MIASFKDKEAEKLFNRGYSKEIERDSTVLESTKNGAFVSIGSNKTPII